MLQDDRDRFLAAMAALGQTFDKEITKILADVYWDAFLPVSIEDFEAVSKRHILTGKWFPKPAELLEALAGGPVEQRAELAWQKAWGEVSHTGAYQTPAFKDVAIEHTIKAMGGWIEFCRPTEQEWAWRKRFLDLYATFDYRRNQLQPTLLCGIADAENARNGFHDHLSGPYFERRQSTANALLRGVEMSELRQKI